MDSHFLKHFIRRSSKQNFILSFLVAAMTRHNLVLMHIYKKWKQ